MKSGYPLRDVPRIVLKPALKLEFVSPIRESRMLRATLITLTVNLLCVVPAWSQSWGNIKGKVVWDGPSIPTPEAAKVDKDQAHCLAKGQLLKDDLVIDASSKGVKNVMVWLAPVNAQDKLPVHPSLSAVPSKPVVIDQPMCLFEPRIVMIREGQKLQVKNSSPIAHNARISGNPDVNGTINLTIPPGGMIERTLRAERRPLMLACDIHGWMAGRIGVFNHPYFALTNADGSFEIKNAPAGKYLIYIQHERGGWLHEGRRSSGQQITIPANGTLDLGTIKFKPDYLK